MKTMGLDEALGAVEKLFRNTNIEIPSSRAGVESQVLEFSGTAISRPRGDYGKRLDLHAEFWVSRGDDS